MKKFPDLTPTDIEHLLRLAYLNGISDTMMEQEKPRSFNVLTTFQERIKKENEENG